MRHPAWLAAAGSAAGITLIASAKAIRLRQVNRSAADQAISKYGSIIYAVWHGRFWVPAAVLGHEGTALLISMSSDGEIIARACGMLGYHAVRGSSSRRGSESLRELDAVLAEGRNAAITPDGPRGPRHHARMGIVALASRSGKPIIPLSSASHWAKVMNSWDRFQVPLPGSRSVIVYGEPILVPKEEDLEPHRKNLEDRLKALESAADDWAARP